MLDLEPSSKGSRRKCLLPFFLARTRNRPSDDPAPMTKRKRKSSSLLAANLKRGEATEPSRGVKNKARNRDEETGSHPKIGPPEILPETPPEALASDSAVPAVFPARLLVSLLIVFHLAALIIALSANLTPSFLQGELNTYLAPYHVTTGQDYLMLPLELTHGASMDRPFSVQFRLSGNPNWHDMDLPGAVTVRNGATRFTRSRWPNFSRLLVWIMENEPESELLSEFASQCVRHLEATESNKSADLRNDESSEAITEIRFIQPHVLSFDEALIVAEGQEELIAEELSPEILYHGYVVRIGSEIGLIPAEDSSRTAKPIPVTGRGDP